MAHFLDDDHRRLLVQNLVDRDHRPHLHHDLDDFDRLHRHLVRQIGHRNGFRHMHFAHDDIGWRLEAALTIIRRMTVLLVPVATTLPGTAQIGRACLDARFSAVVVASVATLLGILARRIRPLVQGSLLAGRFLRLGLSCSHLTRLFGHLGRLGRYLGLLTHADQFSLARQLVLDFLFLNLTQLAITTILLLARLQLFLADHRGTRNDTARWCGFRLGHRDHGRFDNGLGRCFDDRLDDRLDHRLDYRFGDRFHRNLDYRPVSTGTSTTGSTTGTSTGNSTTSATASAG